MAEWAGCCSGYSSVQSLINYSKFITSCLIDTTVVIRRWICYASFVKHSLIFVNARTLLIFINVCFGECPLAGAPADTVLVGEPWVVAALRHQSPAGSPIALATEDLVQPQPHWQRIFGGDRLRAVGPGSLCRDGALISACT